MPKSFLEVQDEYNGFKERHPDDPLSLGEFAKQVDQVQGTNERAEAYNDAWYKKANALVDRGFRATGAPELAGAAVGGLGGLVDSALGSHIEPTVRRLGEDLPRMTAEALLTIPEAASGVGAPAAALTLLNRARTVGKILGYGGSALGGYAATESPIGAAISAGSMGLSNKLLLPTERGGVNVAERATGAIRDRLGIGGEKIVAEEGANLASEMPKVAYSGDRLKNMLAVGGGVAAEGATQLGINEATRQASMSVGPNAVGITDPSRNPMTAENIAGNVVGLAPFVVHGALALHNPTGFDTRQAKPLVEWIKNRREATEQAARGVEGGIDPVEYHDVTGRTDVPGTVGPAPEFDLKTEIEKPFSEKDTATLRQSIITNLAAARSAESEGRTEDAQRNHQQAAEILGRVGKGVTDLPEAVQATREVDTESRMMAPSTPQGLGEFVGKVNDLIDFYNENRSKVAEGEIPASEVSDVRGSPKQSTHPEARDPSVVTRLQEKGLLPKITYEWLNEQYHATFDDLGNAKFSQDVLAQKVANHLLDNLPTALKEESATAGQVQAPVSKNVAKVDSTEAQFFRALAAFPVELQDGANGLVARTIKFRSAPDAFVQGRQLSRYGSWQRAVITAAETYNPADQTVMMYRNGKIQRAPLASLLAKDYNPIMTPVKAGEGGKGKVTIGGKTIPEVNIEGLPVPENVVPEGDLSVTEQAGQAGLSGDTTQGAIFRKRDSEQAVPTEVEIPQESQKGLATMFEKNAEAVAKGTSVLTSEQAWNLLRPIVSGSRAMDTSFYEKNSREILQALPDLAKSKGDQVSQAGLALIAAWQATGKKLPATPPLDQVQNLMMTLMKSHVELPGVSKMTTSPRGDRLVANRAETALGRARLVVERLINPKAQDVAKGWKGPMAMALGEEGGGEQPLVRFAAPVRLRRWAASPTGGFVPDSLGQVSSQSVRNLLGKLGITKDEMAIYEGAGLEKLLSQKKVPVEALAKWMEEKSPKVEVKKLTPFTESSARAEAQHLLESQGFSVDANGHVSEPYAYGGGSINQVSPKLIELYGRRVHDAINTLYSEPKNAFASSNDAATGRYGVEPKELKDMPGAVDILVRVPTDAKTEAGRRDNQTPVYFKGPHFGDSDTNVLASVRGYVETLPTGEKVFHVFEVQSDWGQARAKEQQRESNDYRPTKDHPLLPVYEQLALKAAVQHARKIGARYVAISDAETAMMTEGHDRHGNPTGNNSARVGDWVTESPGLGLLSFTDERSARRSAESRGGNTIARQLTASDFRPSQEPGMRAAYDQRLPDAMSKLTGERGTPVEFGDHKSATYNPRPDLSFSGNERLGSPVFKDKLGSPKSQVTARLYDITKAPDEFSAYGYSKPMTIGEKPVFTPEGETLYNHPKDGAFSEDVLRTISAAVDRHFGAKGYSGDLRTMYSTAAMAIIRSMKDVPTDFYKIKGEKLAGLANVNMREGRAQVGLGMEPIDMETSTHFVHRVLTALTHELAHIDDFVHFGQLKAPDAYSEERRRQLTNLRAMFDVLDPEQRKAVLLTLDESLTPPGYRTAVGENATQLARSTTNQDEFSATVMTMVTKSLLFGEKKGLKNALETLDFSPVEVQEYAQGQFRAIRDVLQGMESALADPKIRAEAAKASIATGDPYVLSKAFHAVTSAAIEASRVRDGAKDVAAARDMFNNMSKGAGNTVPAEETAATWLRRQKTTEDNFGKMAKTDALAMANAREATDVGREALAISYDKKHRPGWWTNWLTPFINLADQMDRSGVELARPAANLLFDVESAMRRLHSDILAPLLRHEKDGTIVYDKEQPFIKGLSPSARTGFNQVSEWQVKNGYKPMFNEVNGELVPVTEARPIWEKIRQRYSPADQQAIVSGSVAWDKIGQNEAKTILGAMNDSMKYRIAGLIMGMDRTMFHDVAKAKADQVVDAYLTNNVQSLVGTTPPNWLPVFESMLGGTEGYVASFFGLKDKFDRSPGHRTTQLPHDWVVMYKNKDGETRFTSAPDEARALYARDRVVQAGGAQIGEIVNRKSMLGKYADFDDPDTLLLKFSQVEGKVWDRVVEEIRKTQGEAVANNVAGMYAPGAESLSDLQKKTFKKYFTENKGQVDPETLDFLDAGLARSKRLAASVAFKLHGQAKDLLLNDPRARMFPSFRDRVNQQWDHVTSPTNETVQKMRTMGSAYYLALNLSSMAVEGTQSASTVIPMLVGTNDGGGVVRATKQLTRAIADSAHTSSDEWQTTGKQAYLKMEAGLRNGEDVKLTPEELRWGMYYRAVNDGDIGHGVISDMGYSRGQKAQEIALFGQGDYGPVPWKTFVTDKMYNAAQMSLKYYGTMSKFNDKISFFAGLNQGIEKGLVGDELYYHAKNFKNMTTFGGGKANAIGAIQAKDPHIRSALSLVTTLQSYGFGMVANYIKFARESINADKSLTGQEQRQAFKAFTTMLGTQVAVAGVLGVPFAGAAMALIEKVTGVPAQQLARQGIASLSEDQETGAGYAEAVMNGLGNQLVRLDVSSRLGVSSILGTSSYRGFSIADMAGPLPTIAENMVKSLNYFGEREPLKAARELVPQSMKNVFAMADSHAKYGDYAIRDSSENLLYTPTDSQNIARVFGFRSREESQKRQAESLTVAADKRVLSAQDREYDGMARELLQGDGAGSRRFVQDLRQQDPTVDTNGVLRSIMERAVRMTQEKDLLASGSKAGADERKAIVGTFAPDVNTRQSEMALNQVRMQLAGRLGAPELMPSGKMLTRGAMVDSLVRSRGMTRSQALSLVQVMGM